MNVSVETFQKQLLQQAQRALYETPISEATQEAFMATPRHLFVKRYRELGVKEWNEVSEANLESHLGRLYRDWGLILYGDGDYAPSAISQPSLVLGMLDLLQLEPGHKVFELGAASGWNAALMGRLVGPHGHVYSVEIIPEMARTAAANVAQLGIDNVSIIEGDAGDGYPEGALYDRAVFTAGTYDIPHAFFDQIKNGGLLLVVIKNEGGGDTLFLLRKNVDHFASLKSVTCFFVPVTGKYRIDGLDPVVLETMPEWAEFKDQKPHVRNFWWSVKGKMYYEGKTVGMRSYLSVSETLFKTFKTTGIGQQSVEERYFGLWDKDRHSLVIAKDDSLISYGGPEAERRLMEHVHRWVDLGMPNAASFDLKVYPVAANVRPAPNQWIVKRKEAQFLWSLPDSESRSENQQ